MRKELTNKLGTVSLAALLLAVPQLATAQEADVTPLNADIGFIFTTFMFLVSGFLVFFMAAGFAMLEAGLVRGKNVAMQLTKNMALFSLASLFFYILGYNLMYPGDGWTIQNVLGAFSVTALEPVGLEGVEADLTYASVGSDFFFQLMFCAATASIVSGALAERIKLWPFLVFVIVLVAVIYPVQASWKWGGGFLDAMGFQDFAGSTVVHSVGGWAALTGAIILGPRLGKYKDGKVNPMPGSNLALATLGTFILWLGWFGFNGGSQLAADGGAAMALTVTHISAATASLTWALWEKIKYGKASLVGIVTGTIAGLASITPASGFVGPIEALVIGAVAGILCQEAVNVVRNTLKIDDTLDVFAVHGVGGIFGTLMIAGFGHGAWVAQVGALIVVGIFTLVVSYILIKVTQIIVPLRVDAETETNGLDLSAHGERAYDMNS